jgi:hypothetical protein
MESSRDAYKNGSTLEGLKLKNSMSHRLSLRPSMYAASSPPHGIMTCRRFTHFTMLCVLLERGSHTLPWYVYFIAVFIARAHKGIGP